MLGLFALANILGGDDDMRIFVSHPYADNPEVNQRKATAICKRLVTEGHTPISPLHLFSFYDDDSDRYLIKS
jgi:hypothetical protein